MTLRYRIEPEARRKKLKTLLQAKNFVRLIEAHSGLSGLVANTACLELQDGTRKEFDGFWSSSFTGSAVKGLPDAEITGIEGRLPTIEEILFVADKPVVVDGDSGLDTIHFQYTCARLEVLGISAIIIEDKTFPKRNSLDPDARQQLEHVDIFADKIRCGKKVLLTDTFMIIARIESLIANMGVGDALARAEAYLLAGADGIVIHSKSRQPDEIFAFADGYDQLCRRLGFHKPLVSIPTTYNAVTEDELRRHGFNMVIYANHLLRASYAAMAKACSVILENCRSLETEAFCAPVKTISDAVGFSDITQQDQEHALACPHVIIPAAGRPEPDLLEQCAGLPTCAIALKGKTVLQRQLETVRELGITEAAVVTGYEARAVVPGTARTIYNPDYDKTHILDSVFRAEPYMHSSFLLIYADILFDKQVIESLLRRKEDMVVVIDSTSIIQRGDIAKAKIEMVTVNPSAARHYRRLTPAGHEVKLIGAKINPDLATHEFVGIALFSARGAEILRQVYHDSRKKYKGRRFQEAGSFEKAAFTDLLQEAIDRGFTVHALEISQGWIEIQSPVDYAHALEILE